MAIPLRTTARAPGPIRWGPVVSGATLGLGEGQDPTGTPTTRVSVPDQRDRPVDDAPLDRREDRDALDGSPRRR